ncbi:peptidase M17 leucyl aminopeptidase domain-containing protein [Nitratireductor aquibiodomus RA22]|uniref:Peptidase M17 leucyl aminopeptidase domain-containing protein n=1 Tax=Nitratireductor aquibiodomus RA22 TaxID=1189611 RepID=I5BW62_9HYPH|nr:peptidase M17 leucyl aminopeptidase domain-containing protein [Nitratireductor aquibiodomus RA22]
MPVTLLSSKEVSSLPVYTVEADNLDACDAPKDAIAWARANGFSGASGRVLTIPGKNGAVVGAFFGLGEPDAANPLAAGALARHLPEGDWHFAAPPKGAELATLGLMLGSYAFTRYGKKPRNALRFAVPEGVDAGRVERLANGSVLARELINTPAGDMGPDALEAATRALASEHGATLAVTAGEDLLTENLPMIHAVGRAAEAAPRLLDLRWGREAAPKVTLVGKGVCFDTGGLDIKPAAGMLLMKKDMGGAANVLGLASMLMAAKLDIRLRVLIPAVENAVAGNAFRPGDVLTSRKGLTVEIGNTDAEGRLVLADAMALADEEEPELLIDMATLTGAARVALGPDVPPFYTDDEALAGAWLGPLRRSPTRSGACRSGSLISHVSIRRSPTSTMFRSMASPVRRLPVSSLAVLWRRRRAGRISTSMAGTRQTSRTLRSAARRRVSAPSNAFWWIAMGVRPDNASVDTCTGLPFAA